MRVCRLRYSRKAGYRDMAFFGVADGPPIGRTATPVLLRWISFFRMRGSRQRRRDAEECPRQGWLAAYAGLVENSLELGVGRRDTECLGGLVETVAGDDMFRQSDLGW